MFRAVGSKSSYSNWRRAAAVVSGGGGTTLGRRAGTPRRNISNFALGRTTMALRSWRGQHNIATIPTRRTTTRSFPMGGAQRTFVSPSQQELLGSPRFSPLEEFLMDAMAWTVAFSLWYVLNMEVGEDMGEHCNDGDHNDDRVLEYREDYGPTVSQWPSKPSPGRRSTPKNDPNEGKRNE